MIRSGGRVSYAAQEELRAPLGRIREALGEQRTSVQVVEPKSFRSRRTIALPAIGVTALRAHAVRQLEEGWLRGVVGAIRASCSAAG